MNSKTTTYFIDILLAITFGCLSAGAVWLFGLLISFTDVLSMARITHTMIIFLPAIGGLIVGSVAYIAQIHAGGGVVDVIEGINVKRKILANPKSLLKPMLAAISIGTGNPVASEAPVVMLGAQVAAFIGDFAKLPHKRRRLLIACGAGAGFSAAFLSPLAAIAFVTEIILMEFSTYSFSMVALSAGTAFLFGKLLSIKPILSIPTIPVFQWIDLAICILIGISCAFVALIWVQLMHKLEQFIKRYPYSKIWGPAIGGLIAGCIAFFIPEIWGAGYKATSMLFIAKNTFWLSLLFLASKLVGTSFVLGFGGAGGDLAPAIFLGACVGSAFSIFSPSSLPIFVICGICSQLASIMHAPLSALLLSFELSGQIAQVPPAIVSTSVSALISIRTLQKSTYAKKAHERGIILNRSQFQNPLETYVSEVMTTSLETVQKDAPVKEAIKIMRNKSISGLPVLDSSTIVGIITLSDLRNRIKDTDLENPVSQYCTTELIKIGKDTTLELAWELMRVNEIGRLLIVSKSDKLLGIITKRDLLELATRKNV